MLHVLLADTSGVTLHRSLHLYTPSEPTTPARCQYAEITFLFRVATVVDHLRMHLSPYDYHSEGNWRFVHLLELAAYELDLTQLQRGRLDGVALIGWWGFPEKLTDCLGGAQPLRSLTPHVAVLVFFLHIRIKSSKLRGEARLILLIHSHDGDVLL